jgi:hypothetical protein
MEAFYQRVVNEQVRQRTRRGLSENASNHVAHGRFPAPFAQAVDEALRVPLAGAREDEHERLAADYAAEIKAELEAGGNGD